MGMMCLLFPRTARQLLFVNVLLKGFSLFPMYIKRLCGLIFAFLHGFCFVLSFETRSYYIAKASLRLMIFLFLPPSLSVFSRVCVSVCV